MAAALTTAQQETEIGEGLAVGALVLGVTATTSLPDPLDDALTSALSSWAWAARYPALQHPRGPRVAALLRASAGRRRSKIARWDLLRGVFVPQLRDDEWDLTAACVRIEVSTTIAARRWTDLARGFVDGLDVAHVWWAPPSGVLGDQLHE